MDAKKFAIETYSQLGEDINIERILRSRFKKKNDYKGFYVDVGAFHPYKYSNTYRFYKQGWRGINIEPNPENFKLIESNRPLDINLNFGISEREQILKYWKYDRGAFNTFSESEATKLSSKKDLVLDAVLEIKTKSLNTVLEKYSNKFDSIDFISVDVEGMDLEVLQSINLLKWKPLIICVEENMLKYPNLSDSEIYKHLTSNGYKLFCLIAKSNIYIRP